MCHSCQKNKRKKLQKLDRQLKLRPEQRRLEKERKKQRRHAEQAQMNALKDAGKTEELDALRASIRARKGLSELTPFTSMKSRAGRQVRRDRWAAAQVSAPRVVIDCQFGSLMPDAKDHQSLANQIKLAYGVNCRTDAPLNYFVTGMDERLRQAMDPEHEKWLLHVESRSVADVFAAADVVYLTAESDVILTTLDASKVYVIGGLVDHNRYKGHCHQLATTQGWATARLPIDEHMQVSSLTGPTRRVITVNQVFQLLVEYHGSRDWTKALTKALPARKGFVARAAAASAGGRGGAAAADEPEEEEEEAEGDDGNDCHDEPETEDSSASED